MRFLIGCAHIRRRSLPLLRSTVSVLLALGASDSDIDLEAVASATAIPKPRPKIAPPSPTLSPQSGPPTQHIHSRPLNPDAPPLQMPAVTMEQYTACVHALLLLRTRLHLMSCTDCCSSSGCSGACTHSSTLQCTPFPLSPAMVPVMLWLGTVVLIPLHLFRLRRLMQVAARFSCSVAGDGAGEGACTFFIAPCAVAINVS